MKITKILAAFSSSVLLLGATAHAAINPASPGLPAANAYGQTGLLNNEASAMCVDCHSRNPAVRANPTFANSYAPTRADVNGSHYVMETTALAHSGGGWSDDRFTGGQYTNGKYMRGTAWGVATDALFSGGFSKWSQSTGYVSVPAYSTAAPTPLTPGNFGIICESCHNIRINVPAPTGWTGVGNRKLLAWSTNNTNDAAAPLCEGCHLRMKATAAGGNNDAGNFLANQGVGRDHHVLTADPITRALAVTGRLWGKGWAWPDTTAQMGNAAEPTSYLNYIRADALTAGDIDFASASSTNINCTHCHRAHNAQTSTGGLILKSGNGTNLVGTGTTTTTDTNYGLQRQFDRGAKEVMATKLVSDETNLCAGCHNGY